MFLLKSLRSFTHYFTLVSRFFFVFFFPTLLSGMFFMFSRVNLSLLCAPGNRWRLFLSSFPFNLERKHERKKEILVFQRE